MYACGVSAQAHTRDHDASLLAVLHSNPRRHFDVMREFIESNSQGKVELARNLCRRMAEVPALFSALNDFLSRNPDLWMTSAQAPFAFLLRRPGLLDMRNKRAWFARQMAITRLGELQRRASYHQNTLVVERERIWPSFAEWARVEGSHSFWEPLHSTIRFSLNGELMAGIGLGVRSQARPATCLAVYFHTGESAHRDSCARI